MNKEEFLMRQQAARREENIVSIIWLIVFFGVLFGNIPLAKWMDHHKPAPWIQVTYGLIFFSFLLGNLVLMIWTIKRRVRKYGLNCPSCDKPLTATTGQIAVATGKCGHCGHRVFDEA